MFIKNLKDRQIRQKAEEILLLLFYWRVEAKKD